jgi:predicted glutamine amidotransferase
MCRLLGIVGTPPLAAREILDAFFPLGKSGHVKCTMTPGHLDGWGLSGYSAKRAVYFERRAESITEDKQRVDAAADKAANTQSPVIIAHIRKASEGARNVSNSHPFHSRDWIFAHNGTVFGANASFPLQDSQPQGDTDSERLFLWILEHIRTAENSTAALIALLKKYRPELVYSALNFLMTDGTTLWVYREYGEKRLDPGETVEERQKYYTLSYARMGKSALVCSEPLTSLSKVWIPLGQRTLAVFTPEMLAPQVQVI